MRRSSTLPLLFSILSGILTTGTVAIACSCLRSTVDDKFTSSFAVFRGRVVEAVPIDLDGLDRMVIRYRLDVGRVWKGAGAKTMYLSAGTDGASCGIIFDVGSEYVIYANGNSLDSLSTGLCAGNFPTGNDYATTEIAELDRLAGSDRTADILPLPSPRYAFGIAIGVMTARNDRWQSGPGAELWGRYHFTSRSFVRARSGYTAIGQIDEPTRIRSLGRDFYHLGVEGGLHFFRERTLVSPYFVLGSIFSMADVSNTTPRFYLAGEDDPGMTIAPSAALGLEYRSTDLPILFAEVGAASTFTSDTPYQNFSHLITARVGVGWTF